MTDTYLAVFVGSKNSPKFAAWNALSETERKAKEMQGVAAWKAWVGKHQSSLVEMGGPLGKTKRVGSSGIADYSNKLGAFTARGIHGQVCWIAPGAEIVIARFASHPIAANGNSILDKVSLPAYAAIADHLTRT